MVNRFWDIQYVFDYIVTGNHIKSSQPVDECVVEDAPFDHLSFAKVATVSSRKFDANRIDFYPGHVVAMFGKGHEEASKTAPNVQIPLSAGWELVLMSRIEFSSPLERRHRVAVPPLMRLRHLEDFC